ncbi:MAG: Helix-turn-helix domain [Pseudomonadota bacterium]|jgi:putative transcriptional regulator
MGSLKAVKKLNARALGARIKAARNAAGMTQSRLAERAGIEVQSLSRIERGAYEPSLSTAVALAAALGMTLDLLVLGERDERPRWTELPVTSFADAHRELRRAVMLFERTVDALGSREPGPGAEREVRLARRLARKDR